MNNIFTLLLILQTTILFSQKLQVEENAENGPDRTMLTLNNYASGDRASTLIELATGVSNARATAYFGISSLNYTGIPEVAGDLNIQSGSSSSVGNGINFRCASPTGTFKFFIGGYAPVDLEMILDDNGNLGIGNDEPKSKLQVSQGDIYIEDINKGVIMKSPNGACWRMTITDMGTSDIASIVCP